MTFQTITPHQEPYFLTSLETAANMWLESSPGSQTQLLRVFSLPSWHHISSTFRKNEGGGTREEAITVVQLLVKIPKGDLFPICFFLDTITNQLLHAEPITEGSFEIIILQQESWDSPDLTWLSWGHPRRKRKGTWDRSPCHCLWFQKCATVLHSRDLCPALSLTPLSSENRNVICNKGNCLLERPMLWTWICAWGPGVAGASHEPVLD